MILRAVASLFCLSLLVMLAGYGYLNVALDAKVDGHSSVLENPTSGISSSAGKSNFSSLPETTESTTSNSIDSDGGDAGSDENNPRQLVSSPAHAAGGDTTVEAAAEPSTGASVIVASSAESGLAESTLPNSEDGASDHGHMPVPATGQSYIAGTLKLSSGRRLAEKTVLATLLKIRDAPPYDSDIAGKQKFRSLRTQTNNRGEFKFSDLPEGEYRVGTLPTAQTTGTELYVRSNSSSVDLVVGRIALTRVAGVVTDRNNNPLPSVTVETTGATQVSAMTNRTGHVQLEIPVKVDQTNRLKLSAPGYKDSFQTIVRNRTAALDEQGVIRFRHRLEQNTEMGSVSGVVTDSNGTALPGIRVKLGSVSGDVRENGVTDEGGFYQFSNVPAYGSYRVAAMPSRDYATGARSIDRLAMGDTRLDLSLEALQPNAILRGRIVDTAGQPVPEFDLKVAVSATGRKVPVETDVSGYFELSDLPVGEVSLQANANARVFLGGISLTEGEVTDVVVPVDLGQYRLAGRVIDRNGQPISGAMVSMNWESPATVQSLNVRTTRESITDTQGVFRFSNIGKGRRKLKISADRHGFIKKYLEVPSADDDLVVIKLNG